MTDQSPQPRKICILGFAPSKANAPFADPSWEIWGVNDIAAYAPSFGGRVDVTFELHHLDGLIESRRRNPQYIDWLRKGKMPVWMVDPRPDFPTAKRFPFEEICAIFPRRYFTNSISWMMALAIAETTEIVTGTDAVGNQRSFRTAKPGCEICVFGVDMADTSEWGSQRPSCEYFVGIAEGCGLPIFIPPNSDLCKAGALYGLDTTAPLRIKMEQKIIDAKNALAQSNQQLAQLQAQREQVLYNQGVASGQKQLAQYVRGVWTMATDMIPEVEEGKDRHGEIMPVEVPSNGKVDHPVEVS